MTQKTKKKPPRIAFTYDPRKASPRDIGSHRFSEIYLQIFKLIGATKKNILFDNFKNLERERLGPDLTNLLIGLGTKDMIIHSKNLFTYNLNQEIHNENSSKLTENYVNNFLMTHYAREGKCEGLRLTMDPINEDIERKKNHSSIGRLLEIPTLEIILATSLLKGNPNYKENKNLVSSWKEGAYLKDSNESNGKSNYYYKKGDINNMGMAITAINMLPDNKVADLVITKREKTPHSKHASHYRAFSFYDGEKTNILAAVLYYCLDNPYSVHGKKEGAIPLTGDYKDREKTKEEKELIKAHNIESLELPREVNNIVESIGKYAAERGNLLISTEVVQNTDNNFFLMDVNTTPGLIAIRHAEFPGKQDPLYERMSERIAQMILNCYQK
ncbi:MAG: hypothetical protein KAK00_07380 [Nanoarchaeota archaeon]|nr:hypothetical protein [Nanoarchaeota archaeon]